MEYSWEEPLCLIENSDDKGLQINEATLARLSKVKVPVSVVAIVGLYRTGKSYLMNLLAGSQSGFSLGSTIQSKTKGIWAWCRPHPSKSQQCLLLLDTEGLGDVEKGDKNHDTWVFVLAVLLSSTLVYNSIGKIDQDALNDLHYVTEMSEHVKIKSGTTEADDTKFESFFPHFIWTLRDFILDLELDGESITSDEYLEHALTPKKGKGKKTVEFNLPRDCIRSYFPSRKCFTFPQPVEKRKMLKDLENLDTSELDPDFIAMSDQFANHVCEKLKFKTLGGRPVTGSVMGNLAKCYMEAIQNGAIPCIQSAVETTAQLENAKAVHDSLELYRSMMLEKVKLPTDTDAELSRIHQDCEKATITCFLKSAIFDSNQAFQKQMQDQVIQEYASFTKRNEEASVQTCSQLLNSLHDAIVAKIQSGEFTRPGGYELYKKEMNSLEIIYLKTPRKGIKANDVLDTFLKNKEVEGSNILAADKQLNKEQKKAEKEKMRAEEYKRQQLIAEENKRQAEQRMIDQQRSHEENLKQLQETMFQMKTTLVEEQEAKFVKTMKEYEDMQNKGLKQYTDNLKQVVGRLTGELREEREAQRQLREEQHQLEQRQLREEQRQLAQLQLREEQRKLEQHQLREEQGKLEQQLREERSKLEQHQLREEQRQLELRQLREEQRDLELREEKRNLELREERHKQEQQRKDGVGSVVGGVFHGVDSVVGGVVHGIDSVVGGVVGGVGNVVGGVVDGVGRVADGRAVDGVGSVVGGVVDGVGSVVGGVVGGVGSVLGGVFGGVGSVVGGVGKLFE